MCVSILLLTLNVCFNKYYFWEKPTKLLCNLRLNFLNWKTIQNKEPSLLQNLPISPNLDRLPLIPGIVEVLNLLEAEVTPAKAVSMKTWEYLHRIKVLQVLIM